MKNTDDSRHSLRGVFAAALTPMGENLNPDHKAFAAHCRRLLEAGCHGLAVFGTTGEANSLSARERISALEALVESGIEGEKLLYGTGSCALTEAVQLSRAALDAGVGGVLVLPPFYYKDVSDEGLFRFFDGLIERVGDERLRVYLYHFPKMTGGIGFSFPLIERLLKAYPGVISGTKDSSGDWKRIEAACREFSGEGFDVFAGTETYLLDALKSGGAGCISATTNVTAPLARQVHDLHGAGRDEEAARSQEQLTGLRSEIEAYPTIPVLKGMMQRLTGEKDWRYLRPPMVALEDGPVGDLLRRLPASGLL